AASPLPTGLDLRGQQTPTDKDRVPTRTTITTTALHSFRRRSFRIDPEQHLFYMSAQYRTRSV
ncbi:hypothetical protein, partial [Ferrimicrobium acidiphilum]|uniref:hypothetical protein n=1 Tax=Ferrimicrobium acidiphilum TaxID=121039 RepID=UPI0023F3BC2F